MKFTAIKRVFSNKRALKKAAVIGTASLISFAILAVTAVFALNGYVVSSTRDKILTSEQASELDGVDCILVLGCAVRPDGSPSHMLSDRIDMGIELYNLSAAPKIIMSGDHGRVEYNEVKAMKDQAVACGISSSDVFMDHAGFSTYESIYRAKEIFCADKIVIVSQEYHLHRAIYLAESLGIEAYGVSADYRSYGGQLMRDIREVGARVKDVGFSIFKPLPTYLGEKIPVWGDGDLTNDE